MVIPRSILIVLPFFYLFVIFTAKNQTPLTPTSNSIFLLNFWFFAFFVLLFLFLLRMAVLRRPAAGVEIMGASRPRPSRVKIFLTTQFSLVVSLMRIKSSTLVTFVLVIALNKLAARRSWMGLPSACFLIARARPKAASLI